MLSKEKIKTAMRVMFTRENIFWCAFFTMAIAAFLASENLNSMMLKSKHDKFLSGGEVTVKESVIQKIIKGDDSSKFTPEELASYYDHELDYESIIRKRMKNKEYVRKHPEPKKVESSLPM